MVVCNFEVLETCNGIPLCDSLRSCALHERRRPPPQLATVAAASPGALCDRTVIAIPSSVCEQTNDDSEGTEASLVNEGGGVGVEGWDFWN